MNLKFKNQIERAVEFHGHLGPYLVLGVLMGDLAAKKLRCKKHFGIETIVRGATEKPKSCLIDGIQISTGCTYGKGNIRKIKGSKIKVLFRKLADKRNAEISLKKDLIKRLDSLRGHKDSELFAKDLLKSNPIDLFNFKE